MALSDLLVALANNTRLYITLVDSSDVEMISFGAAGYANIESDLGTRVVKRITIETPNAVKVSLEDATP